MARPLAGDPPVAPAPAPYLPSGGPPAPAAPSPFSYANQPSLPGPSVATAPTPGGLWNAFRRRWVLGTFAGALVAAAVAAGIWLALPAGKHQARGWVKLSPRGGDFLSRGQEDFAAYRDQQRFLLRNPDLLTRVLADPAVASLDWVKGADDPVAMLEGALRVSVAAPEVLEVTLTGNHLGDMKVVLDQLLKRYVDDAVAADNRARNEQQESLEKLKKTVDAEVDLRERAIEIASRTNGAASAEASALAVAFLQQRYADAEKQVLASGHALNALEAQRKVLQRRLDARDPKAVPEPELVAEAVAADPRVVRAREAAKQVAEFYKREADKVDNPDGQPYLKELKAKVADAQKAVEDAEKAATAEAQDAARATSGAQGRKQLADLDLRLEVAREQRASLLAERDAVKRAIDQTAGGGATIEAQREALKPQREMANKLQARLLELRVQGDLRRVSIAGAAEGVPNNNQNKKTLLSAVGGLGAFAGVVLLISFLEWRTRRVDGVDQVVAELGLRVIGTVPAFPNRASLQAAAAAGGANWRFVLNESINSTRTMLLHAAKSQSMQVVMVTSATQGEGKTSIASQLATSMATAGMRTLIVDCDLRNPSVMKLFELPLTPGVSEVLRGEVDVSDAVQATAVPNLWVIPAGQCSAATIAALAQGHPLETLFNRLRGQFDFVIVDSCPVLPVADALLVAQHVDGVVFSIMQDISQLPKVMTATEKLAQLNIPLVGAVVNGIKQDVYSYGYNYVKQLPA